MTPNALPLGQDLAALICRECALGFELRFCRAGPETVLCDPPEAEFATLFALTDLNEAIAIHHAPLTGAGADQVAAIARALFVALVNARRDPPDRAAQHGADQAALSALWDDKAL